MAHAAGVQLDGAHARLRDGGCVHIRVDVRLHDADLHLVFERLNRALERRGFAGAGTGHEVEQEGLLPLEIGAERVREFLVAFKYALLDFVNLIHLVYLR
ncbi:hypothetical protein SDC9_145080 [bioreactor metagenome]|uniref:Uncharacterized protein n=1 Tax=bioreactor metagenome TaxID=1076179 RepID=A0A645E800_9ZZZZ